MKVPRKVILNQGWSRRNGGSDVIVTYRKIPKISPGAYIFQWTFLRGLFLEGLIFRGVYVWREICVSKSIKLACSGKEIYHFALFCFVFEDKFQVQAPPGDLYSEGRFKGGFFALRFWGAYILRGLFSEFYGILIERNTRNMGIAEPREARGRVPILNARNGKGREIV